jgi:hypothetical protein
MNEAQQVLASATAIYQVINLRERYTTLISPSNRRVSCPLAEIITALHGSFSIAFVHT